jgi:ATP-dependent Zn protease
MVISEEEKRITAYHERATPSWPRMLPNADPVLTR